MLIGLAINLGFSGFLSFALIVDTGGPKEMIVPSISFALVNLIVLLLLPRKMHVLRGLSSGMRWFICGMVWMALPTKMALVGSKRSTKAFIGPRHERTHVERKGKTCASVESATGPR